MPNDSDNRAPIDGTQPAATLSFQPTPPPESVTDKTSDTQTWQPANGSTKAIGPLAIPELAGYEILATLGRGGMGCVLKARDIALDRLVALKLPLIDRLGDATDLDRFVREARAAGRLRHPNICPIYEIGEARDRPYIAMGFIAGQTLGDWANANRPSGHRAAEVVAALAEAVAYAHAHGVVHRDIKPANVMIDQESGQPILMDFGLAKEVGENESQLTQTGAILGTPAYMAPEQASGQTDQVGQLSDVYALGAVLYTLMSGRPPYTGNFGEVLRKLQTEPPPPARRFAPVVHRDLETICAKAMAREPAERYPSAAEMAADLRRFCAGEAIHARPESLARQLLRRLRRHPLTIVAAGVVLVALVVAGLMADRVQRQGKLARQVQAITLAIDDANFRLARLDDLQDDLAHLAEQDAGLADSLRERLHLRAAAVARQSIGRAALGPQELDQIRTDLDSIARHDAELAAGLQRELDLRLRAWTPVFELAPPFADSREVFDEALVRPESDRLVAVGSREGAGNLIETKVASIGNVQIEATFDDATLTRASSLGVALNQSGKDAYHCLVAVPDPERIEARSTAAPAWRPTTLAKAREAHKHVELKLVRNGITIRRQLVPLLHPTLRVFAQREEGRLTLQVNEEPPLVFDDLFPLLAPGVFGLLLPPDGAVTQVRAMHQLLPPTPSALERGDQLFAAGDYRQALEAYRKQEAAATADVRRESRTKQGLCLVQLKQKADAERILESVAGEEGQRWPLVAAAHLWQLRIADRRYADAEPLIERLTAQYEVGQLALLLPEPVRNNLLAGYHEAVQGISVATFNAKKLAELERARDIELLINGHLSNETLAHLVRAYRALGRNDFAEPLALEAVLGPRRGTLELQNTIWFIEEYCWMLRQNGRASQALTFLDAWLGADPLARPNWLPLLVERGRILIALDRWDEAASALDLLFNNSQPGQMLYRHHSAACLVRGFCHEHAGDEAAALAAWKSGMYGVWRPSRMEHLPSGQEPPPATPASNSDQFSGLEMVQLGLLTSLSGQATDEEARALFQWMTHVPGNASDLNVAQAMVSLLQKDFATELFRGLCRTPRGRRIARELALQQVSFAETYRYPAFLVLYEMARQGAFARELSPEEDRALWKLAELAFDDFISGSVGKPQVLALALTWKGTTGFLGWDGVAPGLKPELRAHLAWVMAHRYGRLEQPQKSASFFETARKDSPADSPLRKLAEAGLQAALPAP